MFARRSVIVYFLLGLIIGASSSYFLQQASIGNASETVRREYLADLSSILTAYFRETDQIHTEVRRLIEKGWRGGLDQKDIVEINHKSDRLRTVIDDTITAINRLTPPAHYRNAHSELIAWLVNTRASIQPFRNIDSYYWEDRAIDRFNGFLRFFLEA